MIKVAAIVVTRGDVDLEPLFSPIPSEWERVVWDNSQREDLSVYGRYAAIAETEADVIYVQDDDCVVSDPAAILDTWLVSTWNRSDHVVCNMPSEFRHSGYYEHALVGFGAVFHRDAPERAFQRFARWQALQADPLDEHVGPRAQRHFYNACDVVFTALTPCQFVDVPKENLAWATRENRMYRRGAEHTHERSQMLGWAQEARDYDG